MDNEKNLVKIKKIILIMILLSVATFFSGFLKYTPFEHISLLLFLALGIAGMLLMTQLTKTNINNVSKFFLYSTGIATILYLVLIAFGICKTIYSTVSLRDNLEVLEGLFYTTSLLFLIGIMGSIFYLFKKKN